MMNRCGQCRHFTRTKENSKDLCDAWELPTNANRASCQFFTLKPRQRNHTE
ncbi:hypothetical protein L9G15_09200 [Shewanella sp. A3A]|nr:hypothetical protein [Shewanella ferrihydritica]